MLLSALRPAYALLLSESWRRWRAGTARTTGWTIQLLPSACILTGSGQISCSHLLASPQLHSLLQLLFLALLLTAAHLDCRTLASPLTHCCCLHSTSEWTWPPTMLAGACVTVCLFTTQGCSPVAQHGYLPMAAAAYSRPRGPVGVEGVYMALAKGAGP